MLNFLWFILLGALAGYLTGLIMRGGGYGFWINLLLGIVGGFLGGWIFGLLGIHTSSIVGNLICAVVGAVVLVLIVGLIAKKR